MCIDEYQHVPAVLDAIKAQLNRELRPGRYVITGSTRYDALPIAAQSLTGRLHLLTVWPLTQGEIDGVRENLLVALLEDPANAAPRGTVRRRAEGVHSAHHRRGHADCTGETQPRGTQPLVRRLRRACPERDVRELSRLRQREQLPALLRRLAAQTAGVERHTGRRRGGTGAHHGGGLRQAARGRVPDHAPAGVGNDCKGARPVRPRCTWWTPVSPHACWVSPRRSSHGAILPPCRSSDTCWRRLWWASHQAGVVAGEIAAAGHWRTYDGDEIDLVLERDDGGVLAFEVKAAGQVAGRDMRHLRKLRDALGERFLIGVALYTGARAYNFEDRLHVMPIDRIWTPI